MKRVVVIIQSELSCQLQSRQCPITIGPILIGHKSAGIHSKKFLVKTDENAKIAQKDQIQPISVYAGPNRISASPGGAVWST
jgi:hypothetical protein